MLALQSQGYLQQLTGWQLNDLLFSRSGIVLVMTFNIFPVVYFAVSRSLLASGTRLAVVARVHGASAWRAFWHVTLPMLSRRWRRARCWRLPSLSRSLAYRRRWAAGREW